MLKPVANCVSEFTSATSTDNRLVLRRSHGSLEGLPRSVGGVTKLLVVGFELEELSCAFHAQGLSWFRFILRGSFHIVRVFLFLFLYKLSHVLS